MNDLEYAKLLLKDKMELYGLFEEGWDFSFNNSVKYAGFTFFKKKHIVLSNVYINNPKTTKNKIKNTILHEIAHALVGKKHQHDEKWKATALSLGCNGNIKTKSFKNY